MHSLTGIAIFVKWSGFSFAAGIFALPLAAAERTGRFSMALAFPFAILSLWLLLWFCGARGHEKGDETRT